MSKLICIGEAMGLFMAEEPGELKDVGKFAASIAGAEYNVAVGLARLGHEVAYCTRLGEDPLGEKIRDGLAKNGISQDLVLSTPSALTGFMMKSRTQQGDPKIAYYRKNSAASTLSPQDMDALDLVDCDYLHVTGITPALSPSCLAAVERLIARCRALEMRISFDPNLRPQLWPSKEQMVQTLNRLAKDMFLVLPGLGEGEILAGTRNPKEIAKFYHNLGAKNVVVKLGPDGAYVSEETGRETVVEEFPVEQIVDTVGAGDGFAAGVLSALMEGLPLPEAALRGNVIGAIQISHQSDNESLPTREQLNQTIKTGIARP